MNWKLKEGTSEYRPCLESSKGDVVSVSEGFVEVFPQEEESFVSIPLGYLMSLVDQTSDWEFQYRGDK